jgi:hypothetical protein
MGIHEFTVSRLQRETVNRDTVVTIATIVVSFAIVTLSRDSW